MIRTIATSVATLAFLLAPMVSSATTSPPAAPPGAKCARATYIRPSDGAIVTRTVCVFEVGK